jgi:hypothetical protein
MRARAHDQGQLEERRVQLHARPCGQASVRRNAAARSAGTPKPCCQGRALLQSGAEQAESGQRQDAGAKRSVGAKPCGARNSRLRLPWPRTRQAQSAGSRAHSGAPAPQRLGRAQDHDARGTSGRAADQRATGGQRLSLDLADRLHGASHQSPRHEPNQRYPAASWKSATDVASKTWHSHAAITLSGYAPRERK